MAESSIITSQYVRITHTTAGFGERLLARLIDWMLIGIYIFGWFKLSSTFLWNEVVIILLLVIPVLGYTLLFEVFNQGQTPGKKLIKIKVVMKDGSPATLSAYLLRWLIWPVDIMFSGGIGMLSIFFTKNRQRLGDLAAGTLVIKLDNYKQVSVKLEEFSYLKDNYTPAFPEMAELSME
ncbi:MAG: RDD family protein [Bacteroides sp.]|nr:RDD family protein [Bacteroides sp.]